MGQINQELQLAAEMAAISAVKSAEIVSLAKDTGDLDRFQNRLDDSKDRVNMVKAVLEGTEPHQVTPELANAMDGSLVRSNVDIPPVSGLDAVEGAEALGRTLMPEDYLLTRLMGCESFLGDFFRKSKEVVVRINDGFKEAYIVFTQTHDSLIEAVDALERGIETTPRFDEGRENLLLGARLFNLFKINGQISGDWTGDVSKLSRTISAVSSNYYLNSKNNMNAVLSFFGGFAGLDQQLGLERFLDLPSQLPSTPFKECNKVNKDFSTGRVTAKQSVELMGGAYFIDIRQSKPNYRMHTPEDVDQFLYIYLNEELTGFENSSEVIYPKLGNEVKSLSSQQIKIIAKHLKELLKEWSKVYEAGDKYKLADSDYNDVAKGIYESQMDDELKDKVLTAFSSIVRRNQMELLNLRAALTSYLTLIIHGLIELSNLSVKANTP